MARILITGATGNLGGAVAKKLAPRAEHICLAFRGSESAAHALAEEIAKSCGRVDVLASDLSTEEEPNELIERAVEAMGGIDVLVHLASTFEKTPLGSVDANAWGSVVDINMRAPFFLAQAAAAAMEKDGGSMVFFSDTAAARPYGAYLPYCMAKAGVEAMVKGLGRTLAPKIRVNCIAPYIVTKPGDMSEEDWNKLVDKAPSKRATPLDEIADMVEWLALDANDMNGRIITAEEASSLR